jgi:hypothetical protein
MGKKKDKDKTGKTQSGPKIPKSIGGVKLPKALRHKGEALIAKAASPEGQAAIAKGLTVAATLATAAAERNKAKAQPDGEAGGADTAKGNGAQAAMDPKKAAEAVGMVAEAVLSRLFTGRKA